MRINFIVLRTFLISLIFSVLIYLILLRIMAIIHDQWCCISNISVRLSFLVIMLVVLAWILLNFQESDHSQYQVEVRANPSSLNHVFLLKKLNVYVSVLRLSRLSSDLEQVLDYLQTIPLATNLVIDVNSEENGIGSNFERLQKSMMLLCYSKSFEKMNIISELKNTLQDHFLDVEVVDVLDSLPLQDLFEGIWKKFTFKGVIWDDLNHRFRFFLNVPHHGGKNRLHLLEQVETLYQDCCNFFGVSQVSELTVKMRLIIQVPASSSRSESPAVKGAYRAFFSCDVYPKWASLELITTISFFTFIKTLKEKLIPLERMDVAILQRMLPQEDTMLSLEELKATVLPLLNLESLEVRNHEIRNSESSLVSKSGHHDTSTVELPQQGFENDSVSRLNDHDGPAMELFQVQESMVHSELANTTSIEDDVLTGTAMVQENVENRVDLPQQDAMLDLPCNDVQDATTTTDFPLLFFSWQVEDADVILPHDDYCVLYNSLLPSFVSEWHCEQQLYWCYNRLISSKKLERDIIKLLLDENQSYRDVWERLVELVVASPNEEKKTEIITEDDFYVVHHFLLIVLGRVMCNHSQIIDKQDISTLRSRIVGCLEFFSQVLSLERKKEVVDGY